MDGMARQLGPAKVKPSDYHYRSLSSWPQCRASVGLRPPSWAPGQSSRPQTDCHMSEQTPPGAKERSEAERRQAQRWGLRGLLREETSAPISLYICQSRLSKHGACANICEAIITAHHRRSRAKITPFTPPDPTRKKWGEHHG